ncbi:importin-7-like [Styela clava]
MDPKKVVEILEGTMHPALRQEAESKLDEMHKISGFAPLLLQIVMSEEIPMAVRQAGAIYMKNMCTKWWRKDPEDDESTDVFFIHENDKAIIRENIVEAIIHAPEVIRSQMSVTVYQIIREDFPERWPGIIDKIANYLGGDPNTWMGALQTLYQLVKKYEYKKREERVPLLEAMKIFLPALGQLFQHALNDGSAQSVLIQKQCLKVIYALTQYSLPLKLIEGAVLDTWMKYIQIVIEEAPPEETLQVDELERPDLPWWKCKKWALHILTRVFERYGSPGTVSQEYNQFSEFFLRRYAVGATHVLLKVLGDYSKGKYVSPRVLQQTMQFLEQGVSHSQTWKVMKGVYDEVLKDVIFPLMCFSEKDEELWSDDPHEFVRERFDFKEDFFSPSSAAQCFLQSACTKRKQVVQKTMGFCHKVLVANETKTEPRRKEGALHIIGSLSSTLRKRKVYKSQLESMLFTHVIPEYKSTLGYMRARAVWVTQHFSRITFKKDSNIFAVADGIRTLLIDDPELPVRVEAAFALQTLLLHKEKAEKRCEPYINVMIQSLLQLVHETENDELTSVVHKIICLYCEQVIPYAVDITQSLVMTFFKLLTDENGQINGTGDDDDEASDNRSVAAMGVLSTIETVLDTMEEQRDITVQLESIVVPVVAHVLKNRIMDFYEEILSLMYSLTCQAISPQMWEALPLIKVIFDDDGFDYFSEMMPVVHNFCTVDTDVFLSNTKNMETVFEMCKKILEEQNGEDAESHAVKLLEVIILQCHGKIDQCIPSFVQLALERLTKEVKTSELRTMCLQVVIAALYYNPTLLFQTLESMQFPNTTETVTEQFFRQWLKDADCFLGIHDRRISVLGLCTVIDSAERPKIISELAPDILPSLILMLQGLTQAYRSRGEENSSESSNSDEEEDESDHEREELESSEDEVDEESAEYLEMLEKSSLNGIDGDSDISDGETPLEIYASSFDDEDNVGSEYFIFKQVLKQLELNNNGWYNQLVSGLTDDQRKNLQEVFTTADQRQAEAESKKIEKTGGYQFNTTNVPTTFNFSASGPPPAFSP